MSRPLRIEYPGALYHVTARGNARADIFLDDTDRHRFLGLAGEISTARGWRVHAWCLMTNHYHLLFETPAPDLARGMRQLNGVYTQSFNRRHSRVGHLLQGRYHAVLVEKEAHLLALARYVVLNPVRARLVLRAADWPWSSYRATAGEAAAPDWLETDWLLGRFGLTPQRAQLAWRAYVADGESGPNVWDNLKGQIYLGSETFVERLRAGIPPDRKLAGVPRAQHRAAPPPIDVSTRNGAVRDAAIVRAVHDGHAQAAVARAFGLHESTVSRIVRKAQGLKREDGRPGVRSEQGAASAGSALPAC